MTVNAVHDDVVMARGLLTSRGWIARGAESFRHLPPPGADVWLGGDVAPSCDGAAESLAGSGWMLQPVERAPQGRVQARWLDAGDPLQRAELFAGLALPGEGDAAPFAWAHRALCRDGLRLRIGDPEGFGAGSTIGLLLRRQVAALVEAPMLVVEVLPGVQCVLVEAHDGDASLRDHAIVQNLHVHVSLGQGSTMRHLRASVPGAHDRVAHHVHARVGRDARYGQALVASGCGYHLQRSVLDLHGDGASASAGGALFAAGSALEQQVQVSHAAARTRSDVQALVLASGAARAVVNAHTRIAPGADEADARQRLVGVPTGGQPKLVLRPHLEIHHDSVRAAHGATWGALPQDALFYAQQRGLDEDHARALVAEGMATALLERCLGEAGLLEAAGADALLARAVARHLHRAQEDTHG